MTEEIIHLAAQPVVFGPRGVQRCAWCGAVIERWDLRMVAMQEDSREERYRGLPLAHEEMPRWEGLVAVDGRVRYQVEDPEDAQAPDRSCMVLLPVDEERDPGETRARALEAATDACFELNERRELSYATEQMVRAAVEAAMGVVLG